MSQVQRFSAAALLAFTRDALASCGVPMVDAEIAAKQMIEADLTGFAPAEFDEDVKAVTYHEAEVRHGNGLWSTMLVFDI